MKFDILKLGDNSFQEDAIIMGSHSLMLGNTPDVLTAERIIEKLEKQGGTDMGKFGFFDSSSPNYTTFYPDVKAEDLAPNDAEFVYPTFRLLSMTTVNADSYPVDFTSPGVLKDSMNLLYGITVNPDHETIIGNALGSVQKVFWQNTYTDPNSGVKVPAGINGVFKIDGKSNPRIARGILMSPPSIHSNSVTIRFQWAKSHPALSDNDFYNQWGSVLADGTQVRKIATKVMLYRETSLVSLGADPWAQITNADGKIINPTRGKIFYATQANKAGNNGLSIYESDWKNTDTWGAQTSHNSFSFNNNNQKTDPMELDFQALSATLELTGDDVIQDEAGLTAYIQGLHQQVTDLNTTNSNLTATMPSTEVLVALAKEGATDYITGEDFMAHANKVAQLDAHLTSLREKTIASLKLIKGDDVKQELIDVISNGSLATVEAFNNTYEQELNELMPLTCTCGSTEISRGTAKKHGNEENTHNTKLTSRQVAENARTKNRMASNQSFTGVKPK